MGKHRAPRRASSRRPVLVAVVALAVLAAAGASAYALTRGDGDPGRDRLVAAAPRPTPSPSATAGPTVPATPTALPSATPGNQPPPTAPRLDIVPGGSARVGTGRLFRYLVEVEAGLGADGAAFAAAVERTLADPRGWTGGGRWAFQRTDRAPVDFRVVLASPALTDRLCAPLSTGGTQSCHQKGRAVLNAARWQHGAGTYGRDVASYRLYLVNHEVGHALGYVHRGCPERGQVSPVMVQQTISLEGCRPNPWPYPR